MQVNIKKVVYKEKNMKFLGLIKDKLEEKDKTVATKINLEKSDDEIIDDLIIKGLLNFETDTDDDEKI